MVDFKAAEAFLSVLGGEIFTFQTFTDSKELKAEQAALAEAKGKKPFDPLARAMVGTFAEHKDLLLALSSQGAGVYVQVNAGQGRGKKHITGIRAVFVDIDSPSTSAKSLSSIKKYMPRASILVQSSPGKFHVYWCVKDCPLDLFSNFQQSLAIKFFTDMAIKNLDRVMRVPGFPHQKGEPQAVKLLMTSEHQYATDDLRKMAAGAPNLTPTATPARDVKHGLPKDSFGLDIAGHEQVTVLREGSRTNDAVAEIGYQISQGYSAAEVRANIIKINADSPVPLTDNEMEVEVLQCIEGFAEKREAEKSERVAVREDELAEKKHLKGIPKPPVDMPSVAPPPPKTDPSEKEGHTLGKWIERFRFVENGSRVIDTTKSGIHSESSLTDSKNKYANVFINKQAKLHNKWFQHPLRKDVRDTIFYPTAQKEIVYQGEIMWNIYTPSEINAVDAYDVRKVQPFLDHLRYMFPGDHEYEVMLYWVAMTVRHPEVKIPWAPLLISQQGVGKGFIYKTLELLLGAHNCAMILPDRFDNQFNGYMERLLICVDEMKYNNRKGTSDKIKSYVSEDTAEINNKGVGEVTREVFGNFIFFTNHSDATFIEDNDRRFWVYKIVANKASPEYYQRIWKWLREEPQSVNHLLRYLMEIDLINYDHATVPQATEAKLEMISGTKSHIELEIIDAIEGRDGVFAADLIGYTTFKDYVEMKEGYVSRSADGNLRHLWGKLFKALPNAKSGITPNEEVTKIRQRIRCFRNFEYWSTVDLEALKYELTRSIQMATGAQTVLPPNLEEVSGDKHDAKPGSP